MSLTQSIAAVRALGLVVIKTAKNTGINSHYASYADVWETLSPALASASLSVGFLPGSTRKDNEAWIQCLTMEVSNGTDTQSIPFEVLFPEGNRGVNLTQRQGMAHTYGRRYALIDFFHIITGDDDDAQRLGQPERVNSAPTPAEEAHWSEFCFVPAFSHGSEEMQKTWTVLADPSDETGERVLGDLSPGAMAKVWTRHPDHAGINAWRAELIDERNTKRLTWEDTVKTYRTLNLPALFPQCSGEQLSNLAMALR